ncbi:MAG TPA: UDP-N-acetylmuramoyl-L-alanyl-D-glutamate--2,6-diaminopimelate ligase [Candidatus Margulisiibacteriota bacterium]|nr:UDP-N-acetylmuramoyl-L-alanyl-D-glutamate--2,6-diaminopimelate ligase [Candidatus Margulisiibacteriota bacterium]
MKRLSELLRDVPAQLVAGTLDVPVHAVVADSRLVAPGDVFVCLPGYRTQGGEVRADRHAFITAAVARGATAVVVERDVVAPPGVTVLRVADAWSAIAAMACAFFDHPSLALLVIGVTGTSGKTSTTYFIESMLTAGGLRTARFGTIEYRFGDSVLPAAQTTPEAPELQRLLRMAVDRGFQAVVMEVSSHALELRRVGGIAFDVAVFTNISQDHLNFHPDMHHYLRAKGRLFEELGSGGKAATAVVNRDDPGAGHIVAVNRGALLTFGVEHAADVSADDIHSGLGGTQFLARTPAGDLPVRIPHLGEFHVHNALAAVAAGVALHLAPADIQRGLAATPPVPGRFELVDCGQDFKVAVDYAHKPDALERLLRSARTLRPRRIITVFGCGGDRDRGKRPLMGRIAAQLSDLVIVTSDNPRSEPPSQIIDEIVAGARAIDAAAGSVTTEPDRRRAIEAAVGLAQTDDLVLIAGKGHEPYQLFADRRIHFDDREEARRALQRLRTR